MDMECPTKIHYTYGYKNPYGLWIFVDFLWNGHGFRILKNMDYRMDKDLLKSIRTHCVYTDVLT